MPYNFDQRATSLDKALEAADGIGFDNPAFEQEPNSPSAKNDNDGLHTAGQVQSALLPESEEAAQVQQDLREAFVRIDTDGGGTLDQNEIAEIFAEYSIEVSDDELSALMRSAAGISAGKAALDEIELSFEQFSRWVQGTDRLARALSEVLFEQKLATVESSVGVFDSINQSLASIDIGHSPTRRQIKQARKRQQNPRDELLGRLQAAGIEDWAEVMSEEQLAKVLSQGISVDLHKRDVRQLHKMGVTSLNQLVIWWDTQHGIDMSSDPHQIALMNLEKSTMISPLSNFRGNWDICQAILLLYIAIMLPYRLGFEDNVELWSFWFFIDLLVDLYFIVDLFINFRTAIITNDGDILYKREDVAKTYMKGWFPVDFVSCLPLSYLEYTHDDAADIGNKNKAVRLLRLFRLLKLLRLVRIKRLLERWEEELYSNRSIRFFKLAFVMGTASHWVCCGWYFTGNMSETEIGENGKPLEVLGWAQQKFNDTSLVDKSVLYFNSYFFASMATIKHSIDDMDQFPETLYERVTYMLCFLVGTMTSAVIIGQVSDMIAHANPGEKARNDAIGLVHAFLHERQVPPWLTRRIRKHFSGLYTTKGTTLPIYDFMALMPQRMARDLSMELGFLHNVKSGRRSCFCKVPFFATLEEPDLIRLGCRLIPMRFVASALTGGPQEYVMKEGDHGDEMFIVAEGAVRIERKRPGTEEVQHLGKLREYDFFGEIAVLGRDDSGRLFPRFRSAQIGSGTAMLLTLKLSDVEELCEESVAINNTIQRTRDNLRQMRPTLFMSKEGGSGSYQATKSSAVTASEEDNSQPMLQSVLAAVENVRVDLGARIDAVQLEVKELSDQVAALSNK